MEPIVVIVTQRPGKSLNVRQPIAHERGETIIRDDGTASMDG
jgi:hypothetical protein